MMNNRKFSGASIFFAVAAAVFVTALLIAVIDICNTETAPWEDMSYFLLCACLGYWRPKLCWLWPFCYAYTLYFVHLWAIRHGYTPPYVEASESKATNCLDVLVPALLGGILGGVCRCVGKLVQHLKVLDLLDS